MRTRSKSSQPFPLLEKVEQKLLLEKVGQKLLLEKVDKVEQKSLVQPFLKVEVDFDESSKAWKANKKSMGNGCYKYICTKLTKTGKQCKNNTVLGCDFCRFHINK